ncbi:MAG TPA: hypothetical protein PKH77_27500 [Anaerolineae bacterium]|nr:hypothetical protein [Anaerolineae bacterium]
MIAKTHKRFSFLLLLALIILGVLSSACNLTVPPSATATWTTEPPLPTLPLIVETPQPTPTVTVAPGSAYESYRDEFLGIAFSYPQTWGEIDARLEVCYSSGYKYIYAFDRDEILTGGRGLDCSEPRGGEYTDYPIAAYKTTPVCELLKGDICLEEQATEEFVRFFMVFPSAETLCAPSAWANDRIYGVITVDRPNHPVIQGMIWLVPLLSDERQAELWDSVICPDDETHNASYTQAVTELVDKIKAGNADAEIQEVVDNLRYMANSVRTGAIFPSAYPHVYPDNWWQSVP